MAGQPITAMSMGLQDLVTSLRRDPYTLRAVWLSLIKFSSTAEMLVPLTAIKQFGMVNLTNIEAGGATALGAAFSLLAERLEKEVNPRDLYPMVYLFTDGQPSDSLGPVMEFRKKQRATVVVCGAGPEVDDKMLRQIGHKAFKLSDTHPQKLISFIRHIIRELYEVSRTFETPATPEPVEKHPDYILIP